jgi:hypothetical protein
MTVTLNLPPGKEAAFKAQAQTRGLTLEHWLLDVDSHDPNIPVLSDEVLSREGTRACTSEAESSY